MKRCLIAFLLVLCMLTAALPAVASSYEDDLPCYEVNAPANQRGRLYMYQSASSSGNPIATYYNGTVLKMLQLAATDTYSYVIGPDQKSGYVRTAWLREVLNYSYDDESLEAYRIIANRKNIYMFSVPSDSGTANAAYAQGTILKMIDYDADKTYALAIGPDGAYGYIRKEYLMKVYDYSDESYAPYRVTSTYSTGYLYMYAKPSSNGTPLATYYNDTLLRVIDYESERDFCLAVGPDGQAGYVRKELISLEGEDGSLGPVFEVFSSRSYVYMYAKPNSGSTNLGRCDNGEEIEIINWGADSAYAFVRCVKNSKYGYIEKKSLIPSSLSPVKGYMRISSESRSYVYLYEKANSGSKNLGRYDNGEQVGILDWNASEDYALVYTADEKIGFMQKASLASLF